MNVLITGGTGSVGQSLLETFAGTKKYNIVFTYKTNKEKAQILSAKFNAEAVCLNEAEDLERRFDIIINNAAIVNTLAKCECIELEDWNEVMSVNLTLPFQIIKQNLSYMEEKKWGRIINISSIYGIKAEEDLTPYTVSKHGLIGLTKSVAKEYAASGITCNAICPGTIDSELGNRLASFYSSNENEKQIYFDSIINSIPAKRLAKPVEIAQTALFLASESASYINGASIIIDGGFTV